MILGDNSLCSSVKCYSSKISSELLNRGGGRPKHSLIKCLREKMFCHESAPSIYKALTVQERNTLDHREERLQGKPGSARKRTKPLHQTRTTTSRSSESQPWTFLLFFPALCTSGCLQHRRHTGPVPRTPVSAGPRVGWKRVCPGLFGKAPCKVQLSHSLGCHCSSHTMLLLPVF